MKKPDKKKTIYKKSMNRSMSMMDCQYWYLGEKISLPKVSGNAVFFEPMFIYRPKKGVTIYYNYTDVAQDEEFLIEYFKINIKKFHLIAKQYENDCHKIIKLVKQKQTAEFSKLFRLIVDFWGKLAVIMILGESKKTDKNLSEISCKLRAKYDTVLYEADKSLLEIAKQKIPSRGVKYVEFLTFEEIESGQLPKIKELEKRNQGYIVFKGNLYTTKDIDKFALIKNINIIDVEYDKKPDGKFKKIKGNSACKGKVIGIVGIVFGYTQLKKIKNRDILVTSMTTPDYFPAMKKAAGFVTDEGGITCHAAIVARELRKPCIIGTKIATQVLKDGDLVEVDANRGIVKILKRAKSNQRNSTS